MDWVRQIFPGLEDVYTTIAFWLSIEVIIFGLFSWGIPFFTRKTKTEIDDILISILRIPAVITIFLFAVLDITKLANIFSESMINLAEKIFLLIGIWVLAWLIYKVIKDIILRTLGVYAEESESNVDDVIFRLLEMVGPLVIVILAITVTIWVFGGSEALYSVLTILGGLGFIIVFLFQEPISNLFSGIWLWLDAPLKLGDFIFLEDGMEYRIDKVGVRVTKLFNIIDHTHAYVPNNNLASQRLVNVTQPNLELRLGLNVGIAYDTKSNVIEDFQDYIAEIANTHRYVLGPWDKPSAEGLPSKKELIKKKIKKLRDEGYLEKAKELEKNLKFLKLEYKMREKNQQIWEKIESLATVVSDLEDQGIDKREAILIGGWLGEIKNDIDDMRRDLTLWVWWSGLTQGVYKLPKETYPPLNLEKINKSIVELDEWEDIIKLKTDEERKDIILDMGKIPLIGSLSSVMERSHFSNPVYFRAHQFSRDVSKNLESVKEIPKLPISNNNKYFPNHLVTFDTFDDFKRIYLRWSTPVRTILRNIDQCLNMLDRPGGAEFRLDDKLTYTADLFQERFMMRVPGFRYPDVDFEGFGESSLDFRLEFFVADLSGDHFERRGDVISDIGLEIKEKLDVTSIEIPFPQRDVWFKNPLKD